MHFSPYRNIIVRKMSYAIVNLFYSDLSRGYILIEIVYKTKKLISYLLTKNVCIILLLRILEKI